MTAKLHVKRTDLANTLKMLKKWATPQPGEQVVLGYKDGSLTFDMTGMHAAVGAEGEWPGEARVVAKALVQAGRFLPSGGYVDVAVQDQTISIGTLRLECVWQETGWRVPLIPRNPTLKEILRFKYEAFPREVEASGLRETLAKAEEKRDTLIRQAAATLAPLGVTVDDLQPLVESCLLRDMD